MDNKEEISGQVEPRLLTSSQKLALAKAKDFARGLHTKIQMNIITPSPNSKFPLTDIRNLAILSRIYVGSIFFELNVQHLHTVFSQFGPIKNISLSMDHKAGRHRGYGFIDYFTPEAAELALNTMNGTELGGRILKIGRPTNYETAVSSTKFIPSKQRLYVANVDENINEDNLRDIFLPFGLIKAAILIPDPLTRKHRGYGFIEYHDSNSAKLAKTAMNNFELAGLPLKIGDIVIGGPLEPGLKLLNGLPKTYVPKIPQEVFKHAQKISSGIVKSIKVEVNDDKDLNSIKNEEIIDNEKDDKEDKESTLLLIENAAVVHEADDDLKEEFTEECARFGEVLKVDFYSENNFQDPNSLVKIFVQFCLVQEAKNAKAILDQRWFGGRKISVKFFDLEKFNSGDR